MIIGAAGNLSRDDDEYDYTYDYENRLTQVDYAPDGGASTRLAHFAYDALARMISSQLRFDADVNGRTQTLKYSYDGVNVLAEYDESDRLSSRFIHGTQRLDERAEDSLSDPTRRPVRSPPTGSVPVSAWRRGCAATLQGRRGRGRKKNPKVLLDSRRYWLYAYSRLVEPLGHDITDQRICVAGDDPLGATCR